MQEYTCPVCGKKMARDLIPFLDHTNQHIIEKIKEKHPDWVSSDGVCDKCHEHLTKSLKK